jgi:ubiquinone/menaquinone biosynthesis C-methylase UbiE
MSVNHHRGEYGHEHRGRSSQKMVDKIKIIISLGIKEGQTILDSGCGDGYMAKEFANLVKSTGKVYAMDTDEAAIENLRKTAGTDTIEPIVGDITKRTELDGSSIDLIYTSNVLHGLTESQIAGYIAETQRLLKPGGILAILEFKKEESPVGPPLNIRISPAELKEIIPLTPVKTADIGHYLYLNLFQSR